MSLLKNKKVIVGVSGGIAAYKSTFLVRLLIKAGAEVKVILTPGAEEFVTPLTLSTLSKNPVYSTFADEEKTWFNHVDIGLWADFMIIAPVTANTLAKLVSGHADNFLLTSYLSAKCPVYLAPAMDLDMYQHPSTQANLNLLQQRGNQIIPAESGELASGLAGQGRMAEPENIIRFIENDLSSKLPLRNKKILITAGPTYEAIDPVRFIGNHSSGKMGYQLAQRALNLGANVVLVSGPTSQKLDHNHLDLIQVTSATQMLDACQKHFSEADVFIASAAVSDYRPKNIATQKIKKSDTEIQIELVKNPDILFEMGLQKTNQVLIGFALETNNEIENAKKKLQKKNLDFIVLNSLQDQGAGFQKDTNRIQIIDQQNNIDSYPLKSKKEVAEDIFDVLLKKMKL
ncbi:MAG: bifunctional phosphopantothenoylcysteine decarboxylase/phosphopantothenate--cysteine ligase CoaBC [Flavobacteriaceae bacterium]|nr:bifunctional phosphopantothenoylcysteine decarboxylase/phosphopantothenate--cysteine ligase CoaBC [Flavobacteriaceae bacterium]